MTSAVRTRRTPLPPTEQAVFSTIAVADEDPTYADLKRLTGMNGALLREAVLSLIRKRLIRQEPTVGRTVYRQGGA
jgi:hypothetical protein